MNQKETIAIWALIGIGLMLLFIAINIDPIGRSPDSGIIDLGVSGTRWLLGVFGAVFAFGGARTAYKGKSKKK